MKLIFKKAGNFILIPYENGSPDRTKQYVNLNSVVSIQDAWSQEVQEIEDGNSPYPACETVMSEDINFTVTLSTYDPKLDALLKGHSFTANPADKTMEHIGEYEIGASGIDLTSFAPITVGDVLQLFIQGEDGTAYTGVTGDTSPTTGQYKYDTETKQVTFASDDYGKKVVVTSTYTASNVVASSTSTTPKKAYYQLKVVGQAEELCEGEAYRILFELDRATCTSVTPPTKSKTPENWSFVLSIRKPRNGKAPYTLKVEEVSQA